MKALSCLAVCVGAALVSVAAPLKPHHLSARPIQGVPVTKSDRAFLTDVAAEVTLQGMAANTLLEFTDNEYFTESARFTLKTLAEVRADLEDIARARGIALPLEGSIDQPRDFERFMNSRNGSFAREYEKYAERSARRISKRFRAASTSAEDPEVRAFAIRHVQWMELAHRETKGLAAALPREGLATSPSKRLASGRAAEIFEPPTNVPLAAAGSPAFPGGSQ